LNGRAISPYHRAMKRGRDHLPRLAFFFVALAVALSVAAAWVFVDRASLRLHLAMAERNRALQVELARNAMEEGFGRLIQENRILATYSFPEYLRGLRSEASMVALLEAEGESYRESLSYRFVAVPGEPGAPGASELAWVRPGAEDTLAGLVESSASLWDGFRDGNDPVVLNSVNARPEPYFMVFFPVRVRGKMSGILATAIGLGRAIDKYLIPLSAGEGRRSFLMFGAGRVMWASDDRNPSLFELDQGSLLTSRSFTLGDGEFTIIADESRDSLLSDLKAIDTPRFLVFVIGSLMLVAALFFANGLYLERRERLALAVEEQRLSARVEARERELIESETRFRKLFDEAGEGILIVDESLAVLECNASACRLLGRQADEIVGKRPSALSPRLQPDGRTSEAAELSLLSRARSGEPLLLEWTHERGDGSTFDAEITVSAVRLPDRLTIHVFMRDVSERKRNDKSLRDALDDRELLLRELHHRVKNNFQFLESLIELQKGGTTSDVAAALSSIQARTSALAAAYLITAERPESLRVDIREYLNVLSTKVVEGASVGKRVETIVEADDIPMSLDSAVSLGLLFHEIVSNAARHGYDGAAEGRIDVSFVREGAQAVLDVRDYGRGMRDGTADGLGLTIVRALVAQLNGTLRIGNESPGTRVEARFPLT